MPASFLAGCDGGHSIGAKLRHCQPQYNRGSGDARGHSRPTKTRTEARRCDFVVDQSGSMATSAIYFSIFATLTASIPALSAEIICFDTSIVELTDQLTGSVEVLFGVPTRRRNRHQRSARVLRKADREPGEDTTGAPHRSIRRTGMRIRCWCVAEIKQGNIFRRKPPRIRSETRRGNGEPWRPVHLHPRPVSLLEKIYRIDIALVRDLQQNVRKLVWN
jgi:hypothetical protein